MNRFLTNGQKIGMLAFMAIVFGICIANGMLHVFAGVLTILMGMLYFAFCYGFNGGKSVQELQRQQKLYELRKKQFGKKEADRLSGNVKKKHYVGDNDDNTDFSDAAMGIMAFNSSSDDSPYTNIIRGEEIKVGIDLCDATEPLNYFNPASPLCTVDNTDMYSGTAVSTDMFNSSNDTLSSMSDTWSTSSNDAWTNSSDF